MGRLGWALAFVITSSAAGGLLYATLRRWSEPERETAPIRRSPSQITDIELNLILTKVREGDLLAIRGDLDGAKKAWDDAARQGAGLWQIHEGVGDSCSRYGVTDSAIREYANAEPLVPSDLAPMRDNIRFKRAVLLAETGRADEAFVLLLELNQPAALGPRLLDLYGKARDKGDLLRRLRQRAETQDPRLFPLVAQIRENEGDKSEAARLRARFCRAVAPWDAGLNRRVVAELRAQKLFAEAVEVCRAWATAEPQNLEAYRLMGDAWVEAGDAQKAYVAYTSMVDVRPGDADAHRALGMALRDLKRYEEAREQFEKSKKIRPEEPQRWIDVAETVMCLDAAAGEKLYDEIAKKTWDGRFGSVVDQIRSRLAAKLVIDLEAAKKAGDREKVKELRRVLAQYNVPDAAFDLKVVMTWDTQTDVDMDVIDPAGEHVHHGQSASKAGGKYWTDNTSGYGPETFTLARAPAGTYRIGAHYHSGQGRTTAKFVVILFEDTEREQRIEHTLVFEKSGEQKFIPDVVVRP
jgi:tetratricopeptide (TPR) repeat protein